MPNELDCAPGITKRLNAPAMVASAWCCNGAHALGALCVCAGKSTTFSMLTGALAATSGEALLHGLSTRRSQKATRKLIGYCPQHDALQSLMTGREMLRMYARIKQARARPWQRRCYNVPLLCEQTH
eukprot:6201128-Pleurochrysis_carterae.AAC.2